MKDYISRHCGGTDATQRKLAKIGGIPANIQTFHSLNMIQEYLTLYCKFTIQINKYTFWLNQTAFQK
jgi:hypothetical protein